METITALIRELEENQAFAISANDPTLQFENGGQNLLFSSVLPERQVAQNSYRDWGIRFKTMIANDATRYSPPQIKNGMLIGSVQVEMGEADAAGAMDMQFYEHFLQTLDRGSSQEGAFQLLRFFENTVSRPLAILRERHRVDAVCQGYVERRGANNFYERVDFPKPAGHRATVPSGTTAAPTGWYDPDHDILGTLKMFKKMLAKKGYRISRIITTEDILSDCIIPNNAIRAYGVMTVTAPGGNQGFELQTRPEAQAMINAFAAIQVPVPVTYDAGYSDQLGWQPFMKNKFVILCQTGRQAEVRIDGEEPALLLPNTIGYYGIGVATGQLAPGVRYKVDSKDGKDANIYAEGWMSGFPIIQDPEAFAVLTIPEPTEV
jgi:hypothetical protein